MSVLALNQVSYVVKDKVILKEISLAISAGECVVLWGLNGAGKSTLLDVLSGWKKPQNGRVILDQKNLWAYQSKDRAKRLAYLAHTQEVYFDLRVSEILKLFNLDLDKVLRLSQDVFDWDVSDFLQRRVGSLSAGEKTKLALLRSLLQLNSNFGLEKNSYEGCYLLLDEPLAHLDMIYQNKLFKALLKLKQCGLGLVMVIHDLNQAWKYADRFFILNQGQLYRCQTPDEVTQQLKELNELDGLEDLELDYLKYGEPGYFIY